MHKIRFMTINHKYEFLNPWSFIRALDLYSDI